MLCDIIRLKNGMASMTYDDILELVRGLSDQHVLKRWPQEYIDGFARAPLSTYKAEELLNQLQHKFFIPTIPNSLRTLICEARPRKGCFRFRYREKG